MKAQKEYDNFQDGHDDLGEEEDEEDESLGVVSRRCPGAGWGPGDH